ncbi:MAG: DUF1566 domain-containing protein [Gammaproteobacteria bacterium]|nr:DUF1566 domain-containing protein [Gammaproteobacteria bacterium]
MAIQIASFSITKTLVLCLLCIATAAQAAVVDLPQSGRKVGQTRYDDGATQIGRSWPEPRFTDNGDGTLTDNLTGLMWLKDVSCSDTIKIVPGGASGDWEDAFRFVDALNDTSRTVHCMEYSARYSDWHVANIVEMTSLINHGIDTRLSQLDWLLLPDVASHGFLNTGKVHMPVWTSTTAAANTNKAWIVNLKGSETLIVDKSSFDKDYHIFSAVRFTKDSILQSSGQQTSYRVGDDGDLQVGRKLVGERYIDQQNGTVLDRLTGLLWLKNINCINSLTWEEALNYIDRENRFSATFDECLATNVQSKEWRMANIIELQSLLDYGRSQAPLAGDNVFNVASYEKVISSTSSHMDPEFMAMGLSLNNGKVIPNIDKSDTSALIMPVATAEFYADIYPQPFALEFGSFHIISDIGDTKTITLTNTGKIGLEIGTIVITTSNRNEFAPGRDQCSDRIIEAGESCAIDINFSPRSAGLRQADITIPSNAMGMEALVIKVQGTGLENDVAGNPACFIATAAYGSHLAPQVKQLREFRDQYLITNTFGKWLVNAYYALSPPIAQFIRQHDSARLITRQLIVVITEIIRHPLAYFGIFMSVLMLFFIYYSIADRRMTRLQ